MTALLRGLRAPCAILLLAAGVARGEAPAPAEGEAVATAEGPWSAGVPEEARTRAEALFREANELLKESVVVLAAARYREALSHWDHPNIHYNLALALMNLDQPVETREHLVAAMRHGPEPLQRERYEHARNYLALLDKQLAHARIRCDVPGARVELDGRVLFVGPGEFDGYVRAGRHTLIASREGLVTNQGVRDFAGGSSVELDLPLKSLAELTRTERRWRTWIPWAVVGAGAAVALGGGALQYAAQEKVDYVDRESALRCPTGCDTEPSALASARSDATTLEALAVGAYGVGGAAVAAGAVLVFLNRGHSRVLPYDETVPSPVRVGVAPILDPDALGVAFTLRF